MKYLETVNLFLTLIKSMGTMEIIYKCLALSVLVLPVCLVVATWKVFPYLAAREKEKTERMKLEKGKPKSVILEK